MVSTCATLLFSLLAYLVSSRMRPPITHVPTVNNVCFYKEENYKGQPYCKNMGTAVGTMSNLPRDWSNHVKSIKLGSRYKMLQVFRQSNSVEFITYFKTDQPSLSLEQQQFISYKIFSTDSMVRTEDNICFYTHTEYRGHRICFDEKSGDLCDSINGGCWGKWNDKVKSIHIGLRANALKIYRHKKFRSYITTFTAGQPYLSPDQQQFTSFHVVSVPVPQVRVPQVPDAKICFYKRKNYRGKSLCFDGKSGDLCDHGGCWGNRNDKVKSIKIGERGNTLKIYDHRKCHNFITSFTTDQPALSPDQQKIASFRVVSKPDPLKGKICFYTRENYLGERLCFDERSGDLCDTINGGCNGKWNHKVKSIKIGKRANPLQIFMGKYFMGYITSFTTDQPCLTTKQQKFTTFRS